jgi:folate-binding protein YgfZ
VKLESQVSVGSDEGTDQGKASVTGFDPKAWPADYGDPAAEYEATQQGAALIKVPSAALLTVKGQNAVQFINGLVTNDVKSLEQGHGTLAAFLDVHGKVQALTRIYRTESQEVEFLLELEEINREKIYHNLSRFVLAGGFFIDDLTGTTSFVTVQGPQAYAVLEHLSGDTVDPRHLTHSIRTIDGIEARAALNRRCSPQGFDLFVSRDRVSELWSSLISIGGPLGLRAAGSTAYHTARIEAGIPKEPEDITPENILLEAGMHDAVSYTKGCYLGQEIIARIHWRGQPARRLCQLRVDTAEVPISGTELFSLEDRKIGNIMSSARSPRFQAIIALGYVHRYHLAAGTRFKVGGVDSVAGEGEVIQAVS